MADFPANTTLIDDFNRADESPPTGWPDRVYGAGDGQLGVISNALQGSGAWQVAVNEDVLPSDFDLTFEILEVAANGDNSMFAHVHLTDPGTSGVTGYAMGVLIGNWTITRIDSSSSFSNLRSTAVGHLIEDGDMLGVRSEGLALELWYKPAAGDWTLVESVDEATYRGGQFGFEVQSPNWRLDNVRGGAPDAGPTYSELAGTVEGGGGPDEVMLYAMSELYGVVYAESEIHGFLDRWRMPDLLVDPPEEEGDDWVEIELDTTAPVVTFGDPSAAEAGLMFSVPYTVNEPGVVRARLFPAEGPAVELTVHGDHVDGLLPPSIVGGPATVRLDTEDEVLNAGHSDLHLTVTSPIGPSIRPVEPSAPPRGTGAPRDQEPEERRVSSRWRRPSSSTSITSSSTSVVRSALRLSSRATNTPDGALQVSWSRWSSSSSTRAGRYVKIAVRTQTTVARGPRREGPEEEAALFGLW